jgi:hypothetical protein
VFHVSLAATAIGMPVRYGPVMVDASLTEDRAEGGESNDMPSAMSTCRGDTDSGSTRNEQIALGSVDPHHSIAHGLG